MNNTLTSMLKILIFLMITLSSETFSQVTITYEGSDEIIRNPERGFSAARSNPITLTLINSLKQENISVIQRIYTIPQYNKTPLPESFLTTVQNDLNTAREGGMKLVLRFSYTNKQTGADAALDTILMHINQLTPVLQDNSDVIAYVEAGFIGAWGEWYYSSHGLNNTTSRRAVLLALLNALPLNRDVVVRTPDYKRKIFQINQPLDFEDAFSGTPESRTGAHNDCFLADATDYGTYLNIEGDKNFLNLDNRFVPQGGETCCDCGYSGCESALKNMARMHWSVLNKDYHGDVLKRWVNEGCMDEIKKRLGYRFELLESTISDSVKPAGSFEISLKIANRGFASPYNPRNLELIIKNKSSNKKYRLVTEEDPRLWLSGDTSYVNITAGIPQEIAEGEYGVYMFLADPEQRLHDNPDYAIRLANNNLWEDSTGYNYLNYQVTISANAEGENYTGDKFFEPYSGITEIKTDKDINPEDYKINAFPNPFNGTVSISFNMNPDHITDLEIYDLLGRSVKQFDYNEYRNKKMIWNAAGQGSEFSSGVYLITMRTKENVYSTKIMFLK